MGLKYVSKKTISQEISCGSYCILCAIWLSIIVFLLYLERSIAKLNEYEIERSIAKLKEYENFRIVYIELEGVAIVYPIK